MTGNRLRDTLAHCTPERTLKTFERAYDHSSRLIDQARSVVESFLDQRGLPKDQIVVVALGSVGRREALDASDLDIIPITAAPSILDHESDQALREAIRSELKIKVSRGKDLTRVTSLAELSNADTIGTEHDSAECLSRRIMVLTESVIVGGSFSLEGVRRHVLETYANATTTAGRHVHSFCNDLARYYRTLCIEYKAKVDVESKDWGTRNMKLRHSRKFWYFSSILASAVSMDVRRDGVERLLVELAKPPAHRIADAAAARSQLILPLVAQLFESYAWFLEFMANDEHRQALARVEHETRYQPMMANPFPALKYNSDLLHTRLVALLDAFDVVIRQRVLDMFLL
jgi:hypothetical protein